MTKAPTPSRGERHSGRQDTLFVTRFLHTGDRRLTLGDWLSVTVATVSTTDTESATFSRVKMAPTETKAHKVMRTVRTDRPRIGRLGLAIGLTLAVGGAAWAADAIASKPKEESPTRMRHAYLGCSMENAEALYGKPTQIHKGRIGEQRLYKIPQGGIAETWFGPKGADAVLLGGGAANSLDVIHQVLHDSAEGGTWALGGRVWRRSDGKAVAIVTQKKQLWVGSCPWLIKAVENEAATPKE